MNSEIKILIAATIFLAIIPSTVFAFGEVAGPVIIQVPIDGSNVGSWGIFNNESINVSISAIGDGAKYIIFPQTVTLLPNNQMTWVTIMASIPSNYQGTNNITGSLYALAQGSPGQVQINLQMEKSFQILVQQTSTSQNQGGSTLLPSSQVSSASSTASANTAIAALPANPTNVPEAVENMAASSANQVAKLSTGLFVLSQFSLIAIILALVVLVTLFYFLRNRNGGE